MLKAVKVLKIVNGILELLLVISFGLIVTGMLWTPLALMLVLHTLTLIFSVMTKRGIAGSILGICASLLGVIPVLGWTLHLVTTILLMIESYGTDKKRLTNEE